MVDVCGFGADFLDLRLQLWMGELQEIGGVMRPAGDGNRLSRWRLRSLHVGFLDSTQSVADRPERSKFVCLHPEAIDVRRISGVRFSWRSLRFI
jgi:hypothetical protein